ncbi:MAG: hypothetical protein V7676_15455 [Parasphingorhabdus sp.]|uniref:hypothetical protein n=1 Tax=Parasphingorhabdus sp. TaxID=2709688 RepID=UPI0030033EE5|tara:strand:- start:590 stop:1201 length:612 start_codon:yes stop_codon:yes gene_type:complete
MTQNPNQNTAHLPTLHQLNRATLLAVVVASGLLVTTVLPAEYGIDPTGVGNALGLKEMGDAKRAEHLAGDRAVTEKADTSTTNAQAANATASTADGVQSGKVSLTLQPNEGREVKATMKAGEVFDFIWSTDGKAVNYDQHGEEPGAASNEYTSYDKGTKSSASGKFRAPFDGTHGWFWRNRTESPVIITVSATGQFSKFELKE